MVISSTIMAASLRTLNDGKIQYKQKNPALGGEVLMV
jgi:hypothetical protein